MKNIRLGGRSVVCVLGSGWGLAREGGVLASFNQHTLTPDSLEHTQLGAATTF